MFPKVCKLSVIVPNEELYNLYSSQNIISQIK
jgi:hypothetical protein